MAVFLVMLVIFNQIVLYPITHWFTNFMPARMTDFWHFYTGNENGNERTIYPAIPADSGAIQGNTPHGGKRVPVHIQGGAMRLLPHTQAKRANIPYSRLTAYIRNPLP